MKNRLKYRELSKLENELLDDDQRREFRALVVKQNRSNTLYNSKMAGFDMDMRSHYEDDMMLNLILGADYGYLDDEMRKIVSMRVHDWTMDEIADCLKRNKSWVSRKIKEIQGLVRSNS